MSNLAESINTQFEIERNSGRRARYPQDVPTTYELIDYEWWTQFLCARHPDAKVLSFRPELPDDLDRGHMRVHLTYNDAGKAAKLPSSVFCKDAQKKHVRMLYGRAGIGEAEVNFYNIVRPLLDIETPKSLAASFDARSYNSIIVFEDLLAQGAEFCAHTIKVSREAAESQVTELARLHSKFYGRMDSHPVLAGLRSFGEMHKAVGSGMNWQTTFDVGFVAAGEAIPPKLRSRQAEAWAGTLKALELHSTRPSTLTHNDDHLRNWYVLPGGAMKLCDWQIYARSDWAHDVAFALATSLTIEDRRAWERELIQFYLEKLHEGGAPKIAFNDAWTAYRGHLFTALSFWTPCLKSGFAYQPEDASIEIIKRVATAIDDLDALDSFN